MKPFVLIPPDSLSPEILQAVIESFVLREGTDYGPEEVSLKLKVGQVQKQILKGEVKIVFDPKEESVTLMPLRDWKKINTPLTNLSTEN